MEIKIINKVAYYKALVEKAYNISFQIKEIKFNLSGKTAGQAICEFGNYFLRFNSSIYNNPINSNNFLETTIPHEIAHLVVFELTKRKIFVNPAPHGKEWKQVMEILKAPIKITHNFNLELSNTTEKMFVYKCACKTHYLSKIRHNKIERGYDYFCKDCHTKISFMNKIETHI